MAAGNPTAWSTYLPWVEYALNSLIFWRLPLHGDNGILTPSLQLPGGRGSSPVGPGTPALMPENLAAGMCVPPTLISSVSTAGEQASFSSISLPPWTTGLALSEGPPPPSGVQEAGATVRRPLQGGSDDQPSDCTVEASGIDECPPHLSHLPGQAGGGV